MRRRRFLAPWHREGVDLSRGGPGEEEKMEEVLAGLRGKPAIYHCMSRIVNKEFVLRREEKEKFVGLMRVYERFCQVRVLTYCVMSNHFHLLLEVPAAPEDGGASWTDEELLGHLSRLYSEREMGELRWELGHYRENGMDAAAEEFRQRFFARMWDLSAYMKVLKQCFTQWFNKKHEREGTLWENRFKSVLVEGGHAARTVAAYIDLNPVRGEIVEEPKDYRWSGYGEAVAGKAVARDGLREVMIGGTLSRWGGDQSSRGSAEAEDEADEAVSWREVARRYRVVLYASGEEREGDRGRGRGGISRQAVAKVLAEGGELSEGQCLLCRVRYLADGLVCGTETYVNVMFALSREYFGALRETGARKLRGVRTELRTMRDLQREPISG